ncbi:MAG: NAD-dependent protein deacylase [Holophagaceae bacterium]|nr:NAD-dependent protein deacylase [Holophagaceae bacterium]
MNFPPSLVILTGAGISAESGVKTFRDAGGLWEDHRIEDVASPEGFIRDPGLVQRFYNARRRQLPEVRPNAAHAALARLERDWAGDFLLVTQNVDDLHQRAGSMNLIAMHGELLKARCTLCEQASLWSGDITPESICPACGDVGFLRPHIVWFGEMPLEMDRIFRALAGCDVFAAIGTSGNVYPAAGFVDAVPRSCRTVELNLEPSLVASSFRDRRIGRATELVPAWVAEVLANS